MAAPPATRETDYQFYFVFFRENAITSTADTDDVSAVPVLIVLMMLGFLINGVIDVRVAISRPLCMHWK